MTTGVIGSLENGTNTTAGMAKKRLGPSVTPSNEFANCVSSNSRSQNQDAVTEDACVHGSGGETSWNRSACGNFE